MASEVPTESPRDPSDLLPEWLRPFFWDTDFNKVSWRDNRDYVVRRLLSSGTWDAIQWVLAELGEDALRQWILQHEGRGLSSKQLRFWQVILDLPGDRVDEWLASEGRRLWEGRAADLPTCSNTPVPLSDEGPIMSAEQLRQLAMALPLAERVSLAEALWESVGVGLVDTDQQAAIREVLDRDRELSSGAVIGRTHDDVMKEAVRRVNSVSN